MGGRIDRVVLGARGVECALPRSGGGALAWDNSLFDFVIVFFNYAMS